MPRRGAFFLSNLQELLYKLDWVDWQSSLVLEMSFQKTLQVLLVIFISQFDFLTQIRVQFVKLQVANPKDTWIFSYHWPTMWPNISLLHKAGERLPASDSAGMHVEHSRNAAFFLHVGWGMMRYVWLVLIVLLHNFQSLILSVPFEVWLNLLDLV